MRQPRDRHIAEVLAFFTAGAVDEDLLRTKLDAALADVPNPVEQVVGRLKSARVLVQGIMADHAGKAFGICGVFAAFERDVAKSFVVKKRNYSAYSPTA